MFYNANEEESFVPVGLALDMPYKSLDKLYEWLLALLRDL